jgi:hypothetical protein
MKIKLGCSEDKVWIKFVLSEKGDLENMKLNFI